MADEPQPLPADNAAEILVSELTWQLLDEALDQEGIEQLLLLLENCEFARKTYIETVQMHVDLLGLHGRLPSAEALLAKIKSEAVVIPPVTSGNIATTESTSV